MKRSVYCQYGQYSLTFRAVALRQRETGPISDVGPMLETLDYTIRIGSTPTFLHLNNVCIYIYIYRYDHAVQIQFPDWTIYSLCITLRNTLFSHTLRNKLQVIMRNVQSDQANEITCKKNDSNDGDVHVSENLINIYCLIYGERT